MEISELTMLVTLDLSLSTSLKLENPNLEKLVRNLTKIRQLYLDNVNISAQGQEWSSALLALPSLEELSLSYCHLLGPNDSSSTRIENLSIIVLDGNNLSSTIPETFANFKKLTTLSLGYCNLRGIFPQNIFQTATLSAIGISSNEDLHGSFLDFPLNGSLEMLIVSLTKFSGVLPNSSSNLIHLSKLDLSPCNFSGALPSLKSNLTKLWYLDLSYNNFIGPMPSFDMLKNLTTLHLSGNYFNGSISSSLFALPLLKDIQLSFNNFVGQMNIDMFWSLQFLEVLDLSHNNLSIDASLSSFPNLFSLGLASFILREILVFLKNQSLLNYLDLSNNQIQGLIPHWIWEYQEWKYVNPSKNYLIGFEGPLLNLTTQFAFLDLHQGFQTHDSR